MMMENERKKRKLVQSNFPQVVTPRIRSRCPLTESFLRGRVLGNLRWRRFRGDGDRTRRESLELRQPSLPVKNRTLRSQ